MRLFILCFLIFQGLTANLDAQDRPFITLKSGMTIESGAFVNPLEYVCYDSIWKTITITGENYTLDFSGTTLWGASDAAEPDQYKGIAFIIKNAKNIRINNLRIHRFHTAVYIENAEEIYLNNCDFSYNYRPRLHSYREHEMLSDWLSYHNNESQQWKSHGSAVYATNLKNSTFESLRITGGFNGILLDKSNGNKVFNSAINFNSGVGIGLYRSSNNIIQHNRLDYNVRGVSHKFYRRGQDSAGVLLFEQCNNNTIAYNSITHSGDGIFLWAGQETMDHGTGGSNDNVFYSNDCSYAPTNGIEVTFSKNYIVGNKLNGCIHGIWGGYSYESLISENQFQDNKVGIAIEHGNKNQIQSNSFSQNEKAIRLWANASQNEVPWTAFNLKHPRQNESYKIMYNVFEDDSIAMEIKNGKKFDIQYNDFKSIHQVLNTDVKGNCNLTFKKNDIDSLSNNSLSKDHKRKNSYRSNRIDIIKDNVTVINAPQLDGGFDVSFPMYPWYGISTIIMTEWGPYDFRYPHIHLADIKDSIYTFVIFGPYGSEWNIEQSSGFRSMSIQKGNYQDTLFAIRDNNIDELSINAVHKGSFFFDHTGNFIPANDSFKFTFNRLEPKENWQTECYLFDDPFPTENILQGKVENLNLVQTYTSDRLHRDWWSLQYEKDGQIQKTNRFISVSKGTIEIEPGNYHLELYLSGRSRVYLNDKIVYDGGESDQSKPFLIPLELQQNLNKIVIVQANKEGISSVHCRLLSR
jgi:parallel beta-helix repeat protein